MTIKAFRSGETSVYWSENPYDEVIANHSGELKLSFSMPSKGGGVTQVAFLIDGDSFNDLAAVMLKANSEAALRAFGLALAEWKPGPAN